MAKIGQNDPKWPKMAPAGPLGPAKGHFGSFWGPFWSSGANNTHKCVLWVSNGSLCGQFWCYAGCILDISWSFRPFGVFWSPFGGLLGDMGPFVDLLATIWAYPEPFLDLLAYCCGKVPPTRGCCPSLGPFGPYLGLCGW